MQFMQLKGIYNLKVPKFHHSICFMEEIHALYLVSILTSCDKLLSLKEIADET